MLIGKIIFDFFLILYKLLILFTTAVNSNTRKKHTQINTFRNFPNLWDRQRAFVIGMVPFYSYHYFYWYIRGPPIKKWDWFNISGTKHRIILQS